MKHAIIFAISAGTVIWLIENINVGNESLAVWLCSALDPFGLLMGLNGVILLVYVVAIPANEIVIPTILMLTTMAFDLDGFGSGAGVLFDGNSKEVGTIMHRGGWTLLTAINIMLFSLLYNPCCTTIYTIYQGNRKCEVDLIGHIPSTFYRDIYMSYEYIGLGSISFCLKVCFRQIDFRFTAWQ